jgi:hypothetical protein
VKAISVAQPWIHQIEIGKKTYEVRSQRTHYRGPVLLVATKVPSKWDAAIGLEAGSELGQSVCLADIVDCEKGAAHHVSNGALINAVGLWCWKLERVIAVPRVAIQGRLGFFVPPKSVVDELNRLSLASRYRNTEAGAALVRWQNWGQS